MAGGADGGPKRRDESGGQLPQGAHQEPRLATDDSLQRYTVLDLEGASVPLLSLWRRRRVVLCFLRQFGCRFCHQVTAGLRRISPQLEAANVAVLAVGMGTAQQARAFAKATGFSGELYLDPNAQAPETYASFGLPRGEGTLRGGDGHWLPGVLEASRRATAEGFVNAPPEEWTGNTSQVGGVFVLGPGNCCDWSHRSKFAGDHPPLAAVLEAATGRTAGGGAVLYPSTEAWITRLGMQRRFRATLVSPLSTVAARSSAAAAWVGLLPGELALLTAVLAAATFLWLRGRRVLAALVTGAVAAVVALAALWARRLLRNEADSVRLYTPMEVDRLVVQSGTVECDCSFIADTDVTALASTRDRAGSVAGTLAKGGGTAAAETASLGDLGELQRALCYFREFLAKEHPQLGREGPTCPFVPTALRRDSLYLAVPPLPLGRPDRHARGRLTPRPAGLPHTRAGDPPGPRGAGGPDFSGAVRRARAACRAHGGVQGAPPPAHHRCAARAHGSRRRCCSSFRTCRSSRRTTPSTRCRRRSSRSLCAAA